MERLLSPIALSWASFLVLWKAWPQSKPLDKTYAALSIILFIGIALIIAGSAKSTRKQGLMLWAFFGVAIWARLELGRNWITPNEIITSGPFTITKHPIYYSVFGAALLSAIFARSLAAWAGAGLVGVTFPIAAIKEKKDLLALVDHSPIVADDVDPGEILT